MRTAIAVVASCWATPLPQKRDSMVGLWGGASREKRCGDVVLYQNRVLESGTYQGGVPFAN